MSTRWAVLSLAVMSLSIVTVTSGYSRPHYIECQSSDECGLDSCCRVGMGRYSIPRCMMRGATGDVCRPHAEPTNTTLSYPDNALVEMTNVYYQYCPCQLGLTCLESQGANNIPRCGEDKHLSNNQLYHDIIHHPEED